MCPYQPQTAQLFATRLPALPGPLSTGYAQPRNSFLITLLGQVFTGILPFGSRIVQPAKHRKSIGICSPQKLPSLCPAGALITYISILSESFRNQAIPFASLHVLSVFPVARRFPHEKYCSRDRHQDNHGKLDCSIYYTIYNYQ